MASFPHLTDVGIMGHCLHGKLGLCAKAGIQCYQSGLTVQEPNMTVAQFKWIASQCKGKCNQLAKYFSQVCVILALLGLVLYLPLRPH